MKLLNVEKVKGEVSFDILYISLFGLEVELARFVVGYLHRELAVDGGACAIQRFGTRLVNIEVGLRAVFYKFAFGSLPVNSVIFHYFIFSLRLL